MSRQPSNVPSVPSHEAGVDKADLDSTEPMLIMNYFLPYRLVADKKREGEFKLVDCYHNPTMLYATLDYMRTTKQFNFIWVGSICTETTLSSE